MEELLKALISSWRAIQPWEDEKEISAQESKAQEQCPPEMERDQQVEIALLAEWIINSPKIQKKMNSHSSHLDNLINLLTSMKLNSKLLKKLSNIIKTVKHLWDISSILNIKRTSKMERKILLFILDLENNSIIQKKNLTPITSTS